jgi:hypothetical protein
MHIVRDHKIAILPTHFEYNKVFIKQNAFHESNRNYELGGEKLTCQNDHNSLVSNHKQLSC